MKKTEKREQEILKALKRSIKMTIEDAVTMLGVSESTVRRLFARLEADGLILRTYGGVQLAIHEENEFSYSFDQIETHHIEEKTRIGICAENLIEEGDILFLDSGTTVSQLCAAIARYCESSPKSNKYEKVILFTNSLANLNILQKYVKVNLIGGEYRTGRKDFCGYFAEETVKNIHFTKCFLGVDGYALKHGLTAIDFLTARLNQLVVENADKKIVLADSSKLNKISFVTYSKIELVNYLITDSLPEEVQSSLQAIGMQVICV